MKKAVLIPALIVFLVSCKERDKEITMTQPINLSGSANSAAKNVGKPAPQFTSSANPATRLNPAHGQPGHTCDVAVGAPLPAANPVQPISLPQQQVSPNPVTIQPNTAATLANASSGKLNPAHGQPGHRCDIAVGAPLNSAPVTSNPKTITSTNISPTPVTTPVAPGMNPQHGQPGHRCDIAVGAPLNSAPAKVESPAPIEAPKDSSGKG